MGVFERMRNGLIQFMYGRNGMDQLNRALLVVYLVVWILRMLTAASIQMDGNPTELPTTCG